jgi:hypothetical protein
LQVFGLIDLCYIFVIHTQQDATQRNKKDKKGFSLKQLNETEGKEQYFVEILNRFAALGNLDAEVEIYRALEAKLQWLQDPGDNQNNIKQASRHLRNEKSEYLKDKINELTMNSKNTLRIHWLRT